MDNILELDPFEYTRTQFERIKFVARALAFGVINDHWSPRISVRFKYSAGIPDGAGGVVGSKLVGEEWRSEGHPTYEQNLLDYLETKWKYQQPQSSFLESFGYFGGKIYGRTGRDEYILTPKAFALLEEPLYSRVFISYKRSESSAFALLLHDRLKALGLDAFVDMQSIEPGENWLNRLEVEINESDAFLCLIGESTLESDSVRQEIRWALEREKPLRAIPVWHNNFRYQEGTYPEFAVFLSRTNAIIVDNEHVLAYDNAIRQLIQFLQLPQG